MRKFKPVSCLYVVTQPTAVNLAKHKHRKHGKTDSFAMFEENNHYGSLSGYILDYFLVGTNNSKTKLKKKPRKHSFQNNTYKCFFLI